MSARYAVYLCPDPSGPAWAAGAEWLGYCAATGEPRRQPAIPGIAPALLRALTAAPRRYGFHATLKAPFHLAPGASRARLARLLREVAAAEHAFDGPTFGVRLLGGFLALSPDYPDARLDGLAARCVVVFDELRAAPGAEELARREGQGLSGAQRALLRRWGYPYVMSEFRPHYSLTGRLAPYEEGVVERLAEYAGRHFEEAASALRRIEGIALFEERAPGAGFRLLEHVSLRCGGARADPKLKHAAGSFAPCSSSKT